MMLVGQMHGNTITCGECATEIIKGNWARHVRARHLEKKKMYLCPIRTCGQSIGLRGLEKASDGTPSAEA